MLMIIFMINPISSADLDFEIEIVEIINQDNYEDGYAEFKYRVSYNSICFYSCNAYSSLSLDEPTKFSLTRNNPIKEGKFSINLKPNQNKVSGIFYVDCKRVSPCFGSDRETKSFSTEIYGYNGDGDCNAGKESCDTAENDCFCSSNKRCEGSGLSATCETYCGNGVCDGGESCLTCSTDCNKCDGLSCVSASECEGDYCVNEKCSSKPYIEGDGVCNSNVGESCKNSVIDCSCGNNERCGQDAVCETYCGNGVCEESEAGICKEDCNWCGDGSCNGNDNCENCELDCGECKNKKINLLNSKDSEKGSSIKCWDIVEDTCEEKRYGYYNDKFSCAPWQYASKGDCEMQLLKKEVKEEYQKATDKVSSITGAVVSDGSQKKEITIIVSVAISLLVLLVLSYGARKMWSKDEDDKKIKKLEKTIKKHTKKRDKLKKE
jgi:hypothetical protein